MGHVLMASLLSVKVRKVRIGIGPCVVKIKCVECHMFPVVAHVDCSIALEKRTDKAKCATIAMGGVTANLLLLITAVCTSWGIYSFLLMTVNLLMLLQSLLPVKGTDMHMICSLCKGRMSNQT